MFPGEREMDEKERSELIETAWKLHAAVEAMCLRQSAEGSDPDRLQQRQRLLLADMAIHLLQTAIGPGDIDLARLRDNLHAVLTISDKFLPLAELKQATEKLYAGQS
jgi:hypothetical protein